jgi:hypothetical protein
MAAAAAAREEGAHEPRRNGGSRSGVEQRPRNGSGRAGLDSRPGARRRRRRRTARCFAPAVRGCLSHGCRADRRFRPDQHGSHPGWRRRILASLGRARRTAGGGSRLAPTRHAAGSSWRAPHVSTPQAADCGKAGPGQGPDRVRTGSRPLPATGCAASGSGTVALEPSTIGTSVLGALSSREGAHVLPRGRMLNALPVAFARARGWVVNGRRESSRSNANVAQPSPTLSFSPFQRSGRAIEAAQDGDAGLGPKRLTAPEV